MTINEYYPGMARILFSSEPMMKGSLKADGWRRATRDTWFRLSGDEIEFLLTGRMGGRGIPWAVYHSKKELEPTP